MLDIEKPPPEFFLLREAARLGAAVDIGDDGQLRVEPETAIPDKLRENIFAREAKCIDVLLWFWRIEKSFNELAEIAQKADVYGARYALIREPDGDLTLAIFSIFDAIPLDLWRALNARAGDIAAALETLGVIGSVSIAEILALVRAYDRKREAN